MIARNAELFCTPEGEAYITLAGRGRSRETWPLRSPTFARQLAHWFHDWCGKVPRDQAIRDALTVLDGKARHEGETREVFTRVAPFKDGIVLDLVNSAWEAAVLRPGSWKVVKRSPVPFRRAPGMSALPTPMRGGSIDLLQPFAHVASEDDFRLLVAWLLQALRPVGPYPILDLHGEQGCGKSTLARFLRRLVDPNAAPLRSPPRTEHDLVIAAKNGRVLAFDNVSYVSPWLSDALCRLATGGGLSTRQLYTDDVEMLFRVQRPVLLTGIDALAWRSDLLDRCLLLALPWLRDRDREAERVLEERFAAVQARVLGALLDAVAGALRAIPHVVLGARPRLADFAEWITAAEGRLGWKRGAFLRAYEANRAIAHAMALESSPLPEALRALLQAHDRTWTGTATELLAALRTHVTLEVRQHGWPRTPRWLITRLKQLQPNLRATGITITFGQTQGSNSRKIIHVREVASASDASDAATPPEGGAT